MDDINILEFLVVYLMGIGMFAFGYIVGRKSKP